MSASNDDLIFGAYDIVGKTSTWTVNKPVSDPSNLTKMPLTMLYRRMCSSHPITCPTRSTMQHQSLQIILPYRRVKKQPHKIVAVLETTAKIFHRLITDTLRGAIKRAPQQRLVFEGTDCIAFTYEVVETTRTKPLSTKGLPTAEGRYHKRPRNTS